MKPSSNSKISKALLFVASVFNRSQLLQCSELLPTKCLRSSGGCFVWTGSQHGTSIDTERTDVHQAIVECTDGVPALHGDDFALRRMVYRRTETRNEVR